MQRNLARMRHNLIILIHIRRPEIDDDVNDEHDVNEQVDHGHWPEVEAAHTPAAAVVRRRAARLRLYQRAVRGVGERGLVLQQAVPVYFVQVVGAAEAVGVCRRVEVVQNEGCDVGRENGGVDDEHKDQPVPGRFEG